MEGKIGLVLWWSRERFGSVAVGWTGVHWGKNFVQVKQQPLVPWLSRTLAKFLLRKSGLEGRIRLI